MIASRRLVGCTTTMKPISSFASCLTWTEICWLWLEWTCCHGQETSFRLFEHGLWACWKNQSEAGSRLSPRHGHGQQQLQVGRGIGFEVCKAFLRTYYRAAAAAAGGWSVGRATRSYQDFMLLKNSDRAIWTLQQKLWLIRSDDVLQPFVVKLRWAALTLLSLADRSSPHSGQSALKLKVLGLQRWVFLHTTAAHWIFFLIQP